MRSLSFSRGPDVVQVTPSKMREEREQLENISRANQARIQRLQRSLSLERGHKESSFLIMILVILTPDRTEARSAWFTLV